MVVSGATGAIGLALINYVLSRQVRVLAICHKNSRRIGNLPKSDNLCILELNVEEYSEFLNNKEEMALLGKYDCFFHLAWQGTVGKARNDMNLQMSNIQYTLDGVELAAALGCKCFIGAGSQAEYGRIEGKISSRTPAFPENGYGIAKLCASQMTRELSHQIGMEHNWVRILSVYGPNDGAQSMIMSTINKLRKNEIPQFTKGEQMWDYLYSGDAGQAFKLVGEKGVDGKVYVLGSGKARPLVEYIEEIRNIVEPKGQIELGVIPYSEKQVMHLQADVKELMEDTGWSISTNFSKGIRNILDWSTG